MAKSKDKYMVIVGFKGTEFNPLSFYCEGDIMVTMTGSLVFSDPMQSSEVVIMGEGYSFYSTKKLTDEEFAKHKKRIEDQEKMEEMFNENTGSPVGE